MRDLIPMALVTLVALVALVGGLFGCATTAYLPAIRVEKTTDTITRTAPDSATLRALFECDSLGRVRLREIESYKGATASQDVGFKDGELRVETRWRTQYIDRFRQVHDTTTVVETRDVVREVRHVPSFFWWCFALALLAVLWGGYRLVRKIV